MRNGVVVGLAAGIMLLGLVVPPSSSAQGKKPAGRVPAKQAAPAQPEPAKAEPANTVLATVGGQPITEDDLEAYLNQFPSAIRQRYASQGARLNILKSLVQWRLFALEAEAQGLHKDAKVKAQIDGTREKILAREYRSKMTQAQASVDEAEARKYYDAHRSEFHSPEQVSARHILLKSREEADRLLQEVRRGGDFVNLARKYSTGPSAPKGGDLGWFGRGKMVPEFEETVFKLKPGEVSDIVKTQFGYHIIKLEKRRPAVDKNFDEVKESIRTRLQRSKERDLLKEQEAALEKKYEVKIFTERVQPAAQQGAAPNPEEAAKKFLEALKKGSAQGGGNGQSGSQPSNPFLDALRRAKERKEKEQSDKE
ncbi:MAG: peptidylprolyl isomerase [Candidatus Tectomicrobia bacterium]|nr:peptidylprolyl isomerase [Candidatus Tectomicrobia bacterium]